MAKVKLKKKKDVTDIVKDVAEAEKTKWGYDGMTTRKKEVTRGKKIALRKQDKIVNPQNPAWNKARLSDEELKDYDKYHEARKKRLKKLYLKHNLK